MNEILYNIILIPKGQALRTK